MIPHNLKLMTIKTESVFASAAFRVLIISITYIDLLTLSFHFMSFTISSCARYLCGLAAIDVGKKSWYLKYTFSFNSNFIIVYQFIIHAELHKTYMCTL